MELLDDNNLADEGVEENHGDEVVENSDILIINHDDENAENISLDDMDGGSGTVDYDDSFLRNESAKSIIPVNERNGSANNDESVVEENGDEMMNDEAGDLIEQGEEAVESVDEVDGAPKEPDEEEAINIEDISPPSVPGSAVSRISIRSAEQGLPGSATVTPRSFKGSAQGSPPQTARSHRSTSTRSRNVSASNQPISASKTPRQDSASSQVSRHTITDIVGSATSRKSGRFSAPGSASSHKSNAGRSAISQTTVVSDQNVAEAGDATEEGTENGEGAEDVNEIGKADETIPNDETTAEVDPDTNDNNNDLQENEENTEQNIDEENTNEAEAALADVTESTKEVNLSSFANLYCVAE